MKNTLEKRSTIVMGKVYELDVYVVGTGQYPKCLVSVNDKEWTSVNIYNFKKDADFEFDFLIQELKDGACKLFRGFEFEPSGDEFGFSY